MNSREWRMRLLATFSLSSMLLMLGCASVPQVAAVCPKLPTFQPVDLGESFQEQLDLILYSRPSSNTKPPEPTPYGLISGGAKASLGR